MTRSPFPAGHARRSAERSPAPSGMSLHTLQGRRKYLTPDERTRFIAAASRQPPEILTLCLVLAWTGCSISEALALTHADLDRAGGLVSLHCLKKRRAGIVRDVPVPEGVMAILDLVHDLDPSERRLWPIGRSTASCPIASALAGVSGSPPRRSREPATSRPSCSAARHALTPEEAVVTRNAGVPCSRFSASHRATSPARESGTYSGHGSGVRPRRLAPTV